MKHVPIILAAAAIVGLALAAPTARAEVNQGQHLVNGGQTKVNNVKAKQYLERDGNQDGYQTLNNQTLVHTGSKKAGTCNMNVGTTQPGQKAPKDVVVTAKDIINICK